MSKISAKLKWPGQPPTDAPSVGGRRLNAGAQAANWRLSTRSVVNLVPSQVYHTERPPYLLAARSLWCSASRGFVGVSWSLSLFCALQILSICYRYRLISSTGGVVYAMKSVICGWQASAENVGDTDDDGAPRALADDQVSGVMTACATGDVHMLDKYVARVCRWSAVCECSQDSCWRKRPLT